MTFNLDDTHLYILLKSGTTSVSHIMSCLTEIKNWMSKNVLQLNGLKLEIIIITPSSNLDCCSALYFYILFYIIIFYTTDISRQNIQRLLIQNAAAKLLTHTTLHQSLWPFTGYLLSFNIDFKINCFFKALSGQASTSICDLLTTYEPDHCLRSSSRALLMVQKSCLVAKGAWRSQAGKLCILF